MKEQIKRIFINELAFCARLIYNRFRPFVIAVTGSTGKTTVKYMTGVLLAAITDDLLVSQENLNSEYGLPLAMLGYKASPKNIFAWAWVFVSAPVRALSRFKYPKYIVLEYASDKPGDIKHLTSLVPPDVSIITNVGVAHLEAFKSVDAIAREKWEIALASSAKIITSEQVLMKTKSLPPVKADLVIVGSDKTIRAKNIKNLKNKTEFDLELCGRVYKGLELSLVGRHNIDNLMLAIMAVVAITGESKKVISAIGKIKAMEGRGRRFVTNSGIMVIDESYNANPVSMIAAIANLKQVGFARKVAILGEMKELGGISPRSHHEIAKIVKSVADYTVGVGEGFKNENLDKWYPTVEQLIRDLGTILGQDDTVLIKGSHSVELEKVVKKLEENK